MKLECCSKSAEETEALGGTLAQVLSPGDVIILSGQLGAGKTVFCRGVVHGLGSKDQVTSPTFSLLNVYIGRLPVYHFDVYRLDNPDEAWVLGLDDYVNGDGITIVEWGEKIEDLLPEDRLEVRILYGRRADERRIHFAPRGIWQSKMALLQAKLAAAAEVIAHGTHCCS